MASRLVSEMPLDYGDPAAEYRAVREGVGLLDRSDHGVVEVTGRDRATFLHALLSNEVEALGPGQGCAATLLDVHGKVQVLLRVWVLEDRILLVTPPGLGAPTVEMLDHYLFSEKVGLEDVTGTLALFMLAGPGALELGERLTGTLPAERAWSHAAGDVDGTPVRVVRGAAETGEAEVWLVAPAGAAAALWSAIRDAGARPVGRRALEPLRIEAGTPRFGADVGPSVLLPEIPSDALVSHSKGCYPGQEVVVRIRDRGHVNRHLRGLVLDDGATVPAPGSEVLAGGAVVGAVTSAALSPGLERPVALAFVRREHAGAGTAVAVRAGDATVPAVVSDLPFPAARDRAAAGLRR